MTKKQKQLVNLLREVKRLLKDAKINKKYWLVDQLKHRRKIIIKALKNEM